MIHVDAAYQMLLLMCTVNSFYIMMDPAMAEIVSHFRLDII